MLVLLAGVIGFWIIASIWVVLAIVISALIGWPAHLARRLRHRSRRLSRYPAASGGVPS
jgi:ABC-type Mn2+/Zn2+ transport system permease subunit